MICRNILNITYIYTVSHFNLILLEKQDREKFFRQKLFGSKRAKSDLEFDFDLHFQSDMKVNFCFSNRNPYFWPQILKEHEILYSRSLNDLEDQGQLQIFNGKLPFLTPISERAGRFDDDLEVDLESKVKVI